MKRLFALLLALLVAAPFAQARAEIVDAVAAVVNGDVITLSELEDRIGPGLPPPDAQGDQLARRKSLLKRAADDAIADKLVDKEAEEQGIAPTKQEIDAAIEDVKRANGIDDATLRNALKQQGLTEERYREMLARQLTKMKVVEMKVKSRVNVSEDDIRNAYGQQTRGTKSVEQVKVRDIIVDKGDDAAAAKAKAEALRKRAAAGADFEKLAQEAGGPLAASGGDLGWMKKGDTLPELEKVLFSLDKGQVGPVVDAGGGFHVLKVEDKRTQAGARTYAEAHDEIRQALLAEKLQKATEDYLADLRRTADVELRLP